MLRNEASQIPQKPKLEWPLCCHPACQQHAERGFCKISHSALQFYSRTKAMGILWFILIFISLTSHGDAHGPDNCKHKGGLCRVGNCISGERLSRYCFKPIILCCKSFSPTTAKI
ncbi:gallinacin-12-like [Colius striatus]|nr:gallinacin-12-like [Colius striatus]